MLIITCLYIQPPSLRAKKVVTGLKQPCRAVIYLLGNSPGSIVLSSVMDGDSEVSSHLGPVCIYAPINISYSTSSMCEITLPGNSLPLDVGLSNSLVFWDNESWGNYVNHLKNSDPSDRKRAQHHFGGILRKSPSPESVWWFFIITLKQRSLLQRFLPYRSWRKRLCFFVKQK